MNDPNIHYLHPRVDKLEVLVQGLEKKVDKHHESYSEKITKIDGMLREIKSAIIKEKRKRKLVEKIFSFIWKLLHSAPLGYLSMALLIVFTNGKNDVLISFVQAVLGRVS